MQMLKTREALAADNGDVPGCSVIESSTWPSVSQTGIYPLIIAVPQMTKSSLVIFNSSLANRFSLISKFQECVNRCSRFVVWG